LAETADLKALKLAAQLDEATINKMAHALGWPDLLTIAAQRGALHRVKWRNPFRNHYAGYKTDREWDLACQLGVAEVYRESDETFKYTGYRVTDLGRAVVRLRLQAAFEATKL
jgi:hypothetical protein